MTDVVQPDWFGAIQEQLSKLRQIDLGFPQGENVLRKGATPEAIASLLERSELRPTSQLVRFLQHCDGLSFPDVHVGYFIHEAGKIALGATSGEPREVRDDRRRKIVVFGSDGGGGRLAIESDLGEQVLYLPAGAVHEGVFDGINAPVRELAADFSGFLQRLLADLTAFVEDRPGWRYMV